MELSETIKGRRSVRKFKPDAVNRNVIESVLELATWAPSAMNRQDWQFVVVQGPLKEEFLKISASAFDQFKPMLEKTFKDKPKIIEGMKSFFETCGGAPIIILAYAGKLPNGQDDVWSILWLCRISCWRPMRQGWEPYGPMALFWPKKKK